MNYFRTSVFKKYNIFKKYELTYPEKLDDVWRKK